MRRSPPGARPRRPSRRRARRCTRSARSAGPRPSCTWGLTTPGCSTSPGARGRVRAAASAEEGDRLPRERGLYRTPRPPTARPSPSTPVTPARTSAWRSPSSGWSDTRRQKRPAGGDPRPWPGPCPRLPGRRPVRTAAIPRGRGGLPRSPPPRPWPGPCPQLPQRGPLRPAAIPRGRGGLPRGDPPGPGPGPKASPHPRQHAAGHEAVSGGRDRLPGGDQPSKPASRGPRQPRRHPVHARAVRRRPEPFARSPSRLGPGLARTHASLGAGLLEQALRRGGGRLRRSRPPGPRPRDRARRPRLRPAGAQAVPGDERASLRAPPPAETRRRERTTTSAMSCARARAPGGRPRIRKPPASTPVTANRDSEPGKPEPGKPESGKPATSQLNCSASMQD